ncbi:hypothetical protein LJB71_08270 [Thermomonas sp. S9]|uniref:hypothetical protein n=1 Tax=Thermomonas sp. S9 TaxID=2885203 RepID=UPI00216ADAED|nr:hypothetical protein [Thermomonas sp. S9]MCR6496210.1 hypothetical protein [Thermomonas sp. S9]
MPVKPAPIVIGWAVQARGRAPSTRFWIVPFTIRPRRNEAKAAFMALWERGPSTKWDYWRRRGYRLVKVTVIAQGDGHGQ